MTSEDRKRDHWMESLEQEELELLLEKRMAEATLKEHELVLAQYRVARLQREVARREGAEPPPEPMPWYPEPFLPSPTWPPTFTSKPSCGECGLVLEGVMGYVCNHVPCPTGLGGPIC